MSPLNRESHKLYSSSIFENDPALLTDNALNHLLILAIIYCSTYLLNVQWRRQITLLFTKADLRLIVNVTNIANYFSALSLLPKLLLSAQLPYLTRFIQSPELHSISCLEPVRLSTFGPSLELASQLYIKLDRFSFQENAAIPFLHLVYLNEHTNGFGLLFSLVIYPNQQTNRVKTWNGYGQVL